MMDIVNDPAVVGVVKWLLALLFGWSAWSKLRDRAVFAGIVADYRLLPDPLVRPLSTTIPFAEAVVAVGLLLEGTREPAALWAGALLVLFSLAVTINLLRGRTHIDCGCFGAAFRQRISWGLVLRNAVLLSAVAYVGAAGAPSRAMHWLDLVTGLVAAAVLLLLFGAWGALRVPALPKAGLAKPAPLIVVKPK